MRRFDLGLLQISDEAVPTSSSHRDHDLIDEEDGGERDEEEF